MSDNEFPLGQTVELTGTFKNKAGALVDPSSITVRVVRFDGSDVVEVATGTIDNMETDGTGVWYYSFTPDVAGHYAFRLVGETTAGYVTHVDARFQVVESRVAA